jgi:uncharacterized phiE125 gp8 family phage protein
MRPQYSVTTPPVVEPVTYEEAAEHVRVDSTDDQGYLTGLISVGREYAEDVTGRVSEPTTFTLTGSTWACLSESKLGVIPLFRTPLVSVSSVKYYAPDATEQTTLDAAEYNVLTAAEPGFLEITGDLPDVDDRIDAIQIEFVAGVTGCAPAMLKHAIKLIVANMYEARMPVAFASANEIPMTLKALLDNMKIRGWF